MTGRRPPGRTPRARSGRGSRGGTRAAVPATRRAEQRRDGGVLFALPADDDLAAAIARQAGFAVGAVERRTFPDGERYRRLVTPVDGRHVAIVGGTVDDAATLELFDLAATAVAEGARALTLVVPWFGYATMERAVQPGEAVVAKHRARLLSALPTPPDGSRLVLVDLHSEGLPHYVEGALRACHVYAKPVVLELVRRLGGRDCVLASTDAGRAKWVESLANDLGLDAAFVIKRRLDGARTEVAGISAQVRGRSVVIYDDMIRTGGSLLGAARAYRDAGATRVTAVATHGVFPGDALDRLHASGLLDAIACTDTHPRARALAGPRLTVASVAALLAEAIG